MVLDEQAVPSVVLDHELLPLVHDLLDLVGIPVSERQSKSTLVVVDVHNLEDEDHVQLAPIGTDHFEDLFVITDERHLADCD